MTEPRRILVIQLRRIGDVLLTTPAVAAVKDAFPRAEVDFLVEPPVHELLEGDPAVSELLVYRASGPLSTLAWLAKVRGRRYDWVIDFMGNPRTAMLAAASGAAVRAGPGHVFHRWAYNVRLTQSSSTHYAAQEKILLLRALGIDAPYRDARPRIAFRPQAQPEDLVGLVPGSRKQTRRWPAASFSALGRLIRERLGLRVVVFWGPGERALAREVADGLGSGGFLSPETRSLKELASAIARCRLVVTNCNGPKHLAVALGVPTVTIHGSSDPASWNPPADAHPAVRREGLSCIGCGLNECPYNLECLRQLSPEAVFEAVSRVLGVRA